MVLTKLPLARTAIDADGASRTRAGLLGELFADSSTAAVLVHRGLVGATAEGLVLLPAGRVPPEARTAEDVYYLGRDDDHRFVAVVLPHHLGEERDLDGVPIDTDAPLVELAAGVDFRHLRDIGDRLGDRDAGLATSAVALAASMNLIGALAGTAVAKTIASGLIDAGVIEVGSQLILCALLGGITWNLITWWFGLPSSSSHALIGGLVGAALAAAYNNFDVVIWSEPAEPVYHSAGVLWKVIVPMVSSPVLGFAAGFLMMGLLFFVISMMARSGGWLAWIARPRWVNGFFGKAQIVSAAGMGFAHGMNDAQKTMGIVALTLVSAQAAGTLDALPGWLASRRQCSGSPRRDGFRSRAGSRW